MKLKPTQFIMGRTNLLALRFGDKYMSIGFKQDSNQIVNIWSYFNGFLSRNNYIPPVEDLTTLEVGTRGKDYTFYIKINGTEVLTKTSSVFKNFTNVKVYASKPWSTAQPGSIKDLIIESKLKGEQLTVVI